jgi:SAM-dependent methyltransferase
VELQSSGHPSIFPERPATAGDDSITPWPEGGVESVSACPVCGGTERELLHHGLRDRVFRCAPGQWNLHRCIACGTGYLDPRPNRTTIGLAYSHYFTHETAAGVGQPSRSFWRRHRVAQRNAYLNRHHGYQLTPAGAYPLWLGAERRQRFDKHVAFLRYPGKGARLLDVGCGNGRFMMQMRALGWEVCGVETDPESAAQAAEAGLDVRVGPVEAAAFGDAEFDAVTLNHVIEHVHDPVGALRVCHRISKPGGTIAISTPNLNSIGHSLFGANWLALDPPRHLVLFTPASLRKALQIAGFRSPPQPGPVLVAAEVFRRSVHIQRGSDPMTGEPGLPLTARLRTLWLVSKANRATRANPELSEELVFLAQP